MVLAAEVGRWSGETVKFLAALADAKAQSCPFILQIRVKAAYVGGAQFSLVVRCVLARPTTRGRLELLFPVDALRRVISQQFCLFHAVQKNNKRKSTTQFPTFPNVKNDAWANTMQFSCEMRTSATP